MTAVEGLVFVFEIAEKLFDLGKKIIASKDADHAATEAALDAIDAAVDQAHADLNARIMADDAAIDAEIAARKSATP